MVSSFGVRRTELGDREPYTKLQWSLMNLVWRVEVREISGFDIFFLGFRSLGLLQNLVAWIDFVVL